jgi:hypothetical protein
VFFHQEKQASCGQGNFRATARKLSLTTELVNLSFAKMCPRVRPEQIPCGICVRNRTPKRYRASTRDRESGSQKFASDDEQIICDNGVKEKAHHGCASSTNPEDHEQRRMKGRPTIGDFSLG